MDKKLEFVCYFRYTKWYFISLGLHLSLKPFNIEIHLPAGFIRIGVEERYPTAPINWQECDKKCFGKRITYSLNEKELVTKLHAFILVQDSLSSIKDARKRHSDAMELLHRYKMLEREYLQNKYSVPNELITAKNFLLRDELGVQICQT